MGELTPGFLTDKPKKGPRLCDRDFVSLGTCYPEYLLSLDSPHRVHCLFGTNVCDFTDPDDVANKVGLCPDSE